MRNQIFHNQLKKINRSLLIWKTLFLLLINLWLDNIFIKLYGRNSIKKNKIQIKRARWFTNQLINLGSAFIKIGQLLSARPDLIPNTWVKELSKLQDEVPQFSYLQVEKIFILNLVILLIQEFQKFGGTILQIYFINIQMKKRSFIKIFLMKT